MEELKRQLGALVDKMEDVKILQAIHTEQLKEHMRRTDLLEARVEQVSEQMEPLNDHVIMVNAVFKFIGILTTIAAALAALKEALW